MVLFIVLFMGIVCVGFRFDMNKEEVFTLEENNAIRGIWSVVVLLVHVPFLYQNRVQDAIGSFAYIGVTMFSMFSSYGLLYSTENKKDYLKNFWKNRFIKLLIPCAIISLINVLIKVLLSSPITLQDFIANRWVLVLLLFNIIFYLFHFNDTSNDMLDSHNIVKNIAIVMIFFVLSLLTELTPIKILLLWGIESLGFIYGIVFYYYNQKKREKFEFCNNNMRYFVIVSILTIFTIMIGLAYLKFKTATIAISFILKAFLGGLFITLMILVLKKFSIGNRVNKFLGKISYEVYLFQFVFFDNFSQIKCITNSYVYILFSGAVIVGASSLIYLICNKLFVVYKKKLLKKEI